MHLNNLHASKESRIHQFPDTYFFLGRLASICHFIARFAWRYAMYKCYCSIPCYLIWIWKTCLPNQFFFNIFLSFFSLLIVSFLCFFFIRAEKQSHFFVVPYPSTSIDIISFAKKKKKERSRLKIKTKTTKTKQTTRKDTANTSMYHSFIRNIFWELFFTFF